MGVIAELRMPTHKGEGTLATKLGRQLGKFLGSRTVVFWGFGVRCRRVKLVSILGSLPNYGCPPMSGRVPGLPVVLPDWGDPCANFLRSGAVVFWGFGSDAVG